MNHKEAPGYMRFNLHSYLELREEHDCASQLYQDQQGLGQVGFSWSSAPWSPWEAMAPTRLSCKTRPKCIEEGGRGRKETRWPFFSRRNTALGSHETSHSHTHVHRGGPITVEGTAHTQVRKRAWQVGGLVLWKCHQLEPERHHGKQEARL